MVFDDEVRGASSQTEVDIKSKIRLYLSRFYRKNLLLNKPHKKKSLQKPTEGFKLPLIDGFQGEKKRS